MISPSEFIHELRKFGTNFFTGVPDSLLKHLCAYITDTTDIKGHIITANEGNAVALGCGHYLATSSIPMIYMQNSGEGNAINPLLSLADEEVYQIPLLLIIGWRGEPGVHDEPQHIKQGKVTIPLLETIGIPFQVLSNDVEEMRSQVVKAYTSMRTNLKPYCLIVKKGVFESYSITQKMTDDGEMTRERALELIVASAEEHAIIVSTTGMASRELYEIRERNKQSHEMDFLTVGSMGHASQIALGIALNKKNRQVICIDGDGSALMHMGAMAIIGTTHPENLMHIILNNGAHDSVGGQPTVGKRVDLMGVARSVGYGTVQRVRDEQTLKDAMASQMKGPHCIEVAICRGNRPDLGRPKKTPKENKSEFMHYLQKETR